MQAILAELGALMGVKGSFVCARDGALLARAMPNGTNDAGLAAIGRSLMQTLTGLEVDRRKRPTEMGFTYADALLLVKNIGTGCLCVLCTRQANFAMVNMTANLAARKVKDALASATAAPVIAAAPGTSAAAVEAPPASPSADAQAAAPVVCLSPDQVTQVEHELARAVGPVAMLVVEEAAGAVGGTRESVPVASAADWLERLAGEIPDEAKRAQFLQAARQLVQAS